MENVFFGPNEGRRNKVDDIQEMGDRVTSGTETIEDALSSLDELATNVEEVNRSIQAVSTATDDQASSTEEVASMVDEVADAAEQVNNESENVSAAAEEQASSLNEVAQSSQTLANQADELQQLLSQFTIDEGAASPDPTSETGGGSVAAADGGTETYR
jgi:methyl-accepting chemotaxis protein